MEYVAEKSLQPDRPMPLEWTLDVLTQFCDALQEAHQQGIIHRDLKPSNLILVSTSTGREVLKVFDFGIAKILQAEEGAQDAKTMVGDFMGTPPYASPDLAARHPARQVPWRLAAEFARRQGGWLPTEAQWEYAARSGETSRALVWDLENDQNVPRDNQANLLRQGSGGVLTSEVGAYPNDQTRQGVMDMAGNVREWCRDPWVAYDTMSPGGPPRLPENPLPETEVMVRGGSFLSDLESRSVTRRGGKVRLDDDPPRDVGFPMVLECPEVRPEL